MMTIETKRRMVRMSIFLVPLIMVKGASFFLGASAPAGATAAQAIAPALETPVTVASNTAITEQTRKTAAKVAALYKQPFGETPLYYESREAEPGETVISVDPNAPTIIVQAILASAGGAGDTALINGKMYKVGDQFEKSGWVITAIDNKARAVTLKDNKTDREVKASVRIRE